jgi:hypothetical protein
MPWVGRALGLITRANGPHLNPLPKGEEEAKRSVRFQKYKCLGYL